MGETPSEGVEYSNNFGRIKITDEDDIYPIYFFPNNRRPEFMMTNKIIKYIDPNAKNETVMLFECGFEQPYMTLIVEGGQVQEVIWIAQKNLGKRPDPSQCVE